MQKKQLLAALAAASVILSTWIANIGCNNEKAQRLVGLWHGERISQSGDTLWLKQIDRSTSLAFGETDFEFVNRFGVKQTGTYELTGSSLLLLVAPDSTEVWNDIEWISDSSLVLTMKSEGELQEVLFVKD